METNTIQENNRLIAEFMGADCSQSAGKLIIAEFPKASGNIAEGSIPLKSCIYNSSWDWLMPVVEKIEKLSFNDRKVWTTIKTFNTSGDDSYHEMNLRVYGSKSSDSKFLLEYDSEWFDTKIEAVYAGVIFFINWYNSQQTQG